MIKALLAFFVFFAANSSRAQSDAVASLQKLKTSATTNDLPFLATCLTNEMLTPFASDILAVIPETAARDLLLNAAKHATGPVQVGAITALGIRRETTAVPYLMLSTRDSDPAVATAAAQALGRIASVDCVQPLKELVTAAPDKTSPALFDAALRCAENLRVTGNKEGASKLFASMYGPEFPDAVRLAAFRGVLLTAGDLAPKLLGNAMFGNDRAARSAATMLAGEFRDADSITVITTILKRGSPDRQIALLDSLSRPTPNARSAADSPFLPVVEDLVRSRDEVVAAAACATLAEIGGVDSIPLLADVATKSQGRQQAAARRALATMRRGDVAGALISELQKPESKNGAEITRTLAARREPGAVPALITSMTMGNEIQQAAAGRAVAALGGEQDIPALLIALRTVTNDAGRAAAEDALSGVAARTEQRDASAQLVVDAMKNSSSESRVPMLRVLGRFDGPVAVNALADVWKNGRDETVRAVAVRVLGQSADAGAARVLLTVTQENRNETERALAMHGFWRVLSAAEAITNRESLSLAGYTKCRTASERKAGLSVIATLASTNALMLAKEAQSDAEVKAEAELAVVKITERLKTGTAFADFVTEWEVSGPYREAGKGAAALFDTAFAPEKSGEKATWIKLPPASDSTNTWWADLSGVVAGNEAVVYLRTKIFVPADVEIALAMGSDDGNKVWINGALVHAKNVMRPLRRDEDHAAAKLKSGWNEVLVKVTQNNQGCGFCLRVREADNSLIEGLRCDPDGK